MRVDDLAQKIRSIPDFPAPGVLFRDITPLLRDPVSLSRALELLAEPWQGAGVDLVAGVEARGFIVGVPVAERLGVGFVPVRKPGKLPWATEHMEYQLEYGTAAVEIHRDAIEPGQRILIMDDLLATGGTASAVKELVERAGGEVAGFGFLIELLSLGGRGKLDGYRVVSLLQFE
ncbi:MAG TPA: adenine phosphoribosyltransferase [Firmicutes bacterium]|nr:adenine phosphoribosyltransferase [Bacillota bacterium]